MYVEGGGVLEDSVTVKYGPVPEAGSCTVSPESGYALTTSYNITCTPFTVTGGLTLKYSIYTYHQQDLEKGTFFFSSLDSYVLGCDLIWFHYSKLRVHTGLKST